MEQNAFYVWNASKIVLKMHYKTLFSGCDESKRNYIKIQEELNMEGLEKVVEFLKGAVTFH